MRKINKFIVKNLHWLILLGVALLCAIFMLVGEKTTDGFISVGGDVKITEGTEQFIEEAKQATIKYAEEAVPTIIVDENGEEKVIDAPTIEFIDGTQVPEETRSAEDGQGAWHDTSTYMNYYNSVGIGACINNAFGAQCFALANDFWENYADRALSSCGTGAAKGTLECWDYNAGDEFVMVWDVYDLQPGDWVVTKGGTWGHIFMAMGYYNNGYIAGFGQNQGGGYCPMGGAATNVVNLNLSTFGGAFRPKSYIKPEPTPTPTPTPSEDVTYVVQVGDTLGGIIRYYGYAGNKLFGDDGLAQAIAAKNGIENRGLIYPGQTIIVYKSIFENY